MCINVPKIEVSWWLFNSELKFDGLAFFSKLSWNDLMSWSLCKDPVVSWRLKLFVWFWSSSLLPLESVTLLSVQVNLFQKLLFLNQLIHNMTRDCSLNSPKNTSSQHVVYKYCFECEKQNRTKVHLKLPQFGTGTSFSEASILASVNPKYDKRLFFEFQKNTSSEHVVYKNCYFVLTFKTISVKNMFWTCIFQAIQWAISCHIVD